MLNQISKLKGNEIFSLVTPEGLDQYIISRDLIGNVLNVVEDILRKREQRQVVPPPSEDCSDAKRLAQDACNKASIAFLNSKDALEKTKDVLDQLGSLSYKANTAISKAEHAEILGRSVSSLTSNLNMVRSQVNTLVTQVNGLSNNMVTNERLESAIGVVNTRHQADIARIDSILSNLSNTVNQHSSNITSINNEIDRIDQVLESIIGIDPEEIVNLASRLSQLELKERDDVSALTARIVNIEGQLENLDSDYEVSLENSGNTYTLTQGNQAIGQFIIPEGVEVDTEVSDESENPIQNQAITNFILEKERVIAEALVDLDRRVTAIEESVNQLQEAQNSNEIPYYTVTYLDSIGDGLEKIDLIPKNSRFYLSKGGSSVDYNTLTDIKMNGASIKNNSQYVTSDGYGFTIEIPNVTGPLVVDYHYVFINPPTPPIFDDDDFDNNEP